VICHHRGSLKGTNVKKPDRTHVAGTASRGVLSGPGVVEHWKTCGLAVTGTAPQWMAQCGVHDDHTPSVSIRELPTGVKVNCFAGCPRDDVLAAVNLTWRDITPFRPGGATSRTYQRPVVRPVPPKPKAELDRILDCVHFCRLSWKATERLGIYRAECPCCRDPWLSLWVIDPAGLDEDRAGEHVQLTCSNGCANARIAAALNAPDPDIKAHLLAASGGWA
jgi:hypothetical protein